MSGTWYPSFQAQLEAERVFPEQSAAFLEDEAGWESVLYERVANGDVEALMELREMLEPIDYDELGWG